MLIEVQMNTHSLCLSKNKKAIPYRQVELFAIHEDAGGALLIRLQQKEGKGNYKAEIKIKESGNIKKDN